MQASVVGGAALKRVTVVLGKVWSGGKMATEARKIPFAWLAVAAALLFGAGYLLSPLLALNSLRTAAAAGDAERLDELVDFPAVRASLKEQLSAKMLADLGNDPDLRDNPFAGLAAMLMPAVIDKAVDLYVTPEAFSTMVRTASPPDTDPADATARNSTSQPTPKTKMEYAYIGLNRFRATITAQDHPKDGVGFVLERRGIFRWQVIRIRLPLDASSKPGPASPNPSSQPGPQQPPTGVTAATPTTFRGSGDGGDVEITLTPVAEGRYRFAAGTGAPGCGGQMEGEATEVDGVLTAVPDGEEGSCKLTMTRSPSGLEVTEDDCIMWHGAACDFTGSLSAVH